MKDTATPRTLYKAKAEEIHTPEKIVEKLTRGYAICFNFDRGYVAAKHELIFEICKIDPELIFTVADLAIFGKSRYSYKDQLLLICKAEAREKVAALISESGIAAYSYAIFSEGGALRCGWLCGTNESLPRGKFAPSAEVEDSRLKITLKPL